MLSPIALRMRDAWGWRAEGLNRTAGGDIRFCYGSAGFPCNFQMACYDSYLFADRGMIRSWLHANKGVGYPLIHPRKLVIEVRVELKRVFTQKD